MANALVVDDSKATRMVLVRTLKELGYQEIYEAADGKEALERLNAVPGNLELIMTDWNMPVMNGLELVRKLRQIPKYQSSPVIMVTTQSEMDQIMAALEAGANEYVMKPFTKAILEDKLRLLKLIS